MVPQAPKSRLAKAAGATVAVWQINEKLHAATATTTTKITITITRTSRFTIDITSSTAQGGGGSFKNRKHIGQIHCCE